MKGFSAEFGHNIIHGKNVNNKIIVKYKSSFHELGSDGICNYLLIICQPLIILKIYFQKQPSFSLTQIENDEWEGGGRPSTS